MYFQDAEAAILVYDITFRESFDHAKTWVKDLQEACNMNDLVIAVVGNKCDLDQDAQVTLEDAHEFAKECKAEVCKEVSARENVGIPELFSELGLKLYKKHKAKVKNIQRLFIKSV